MMEEKTGGSGARGRKAVDKILEEGSSLFGDRALSSGQPSSSPPEVPPSTAPVPESRQAFGSAAQRSTATLARQRTRRKEANNKFMSALRLHCRGSTPRRHCTYRQQSMPCIKCAWRMQLARVWGRMLVQRVLAGCSFAFE